MTGSTHGTPPPGSPVPHATPSPRGILNRPNFPQSNLVNGVSPSGQTGNPASPGQLNPAGPPQPQYPTAPPAMMGQPPALTRPPMPGVSQNYQGPPHMQGPPGQYQSPPSVGPAGSVINQPRPQIIGSPQLPPQIGSQAGMGPPRPMYGGPPNMGTQPTYAAPPNMGPPPNMGGPPNMGVHPGMGAPLNMGGPPTFGAPPSSQGGPGQHVQQPGNNTQSLNNQFSGMGLQQQHQVCITIDSTSTPELFY